MSQSLSSAAVVIGTLRVNMSLYIVPIIQNLLVLKQYNEDLQVKQHMAPRL